MKRFVLATFACCAMASPSSAQIAPWPPQPLVLVHGLASTPSTWFTLQNLMWQDGWSIHTPELDKFDSFVVNQGKLNFYLYDQGLGSNTVLLGHSMGGIISRLSSQSNNVLGVTSIGTPHLGAPAARAIRPDWNNPFLQTEVELVGLLSDLEAIPYDGSEWANEWISEMEINEIRYRGYNAWNNLQYMNTFGLVPSLLRVFGAGGGAAQDLAHDSWAIANLNAGAHNENGSIRRSFVSIMIWGIHRPPVYVYPPPRACRLFGKSDDQRRLPDVLRGLGPADGRRVF